MTSKSQPSTVCGNCKQDMRIDGITAVANGYDMWSYICQGCGHHFRTVAARTIESASISERRVVVRLGVLKSAFVEAGEEIASCVIRDISAGGAGISLTERARIPKRFKIVMHGAELQCRLIWRNQGFFGVEFR